jgi:sulfite oxidase
MFHLFGKSDDLIVHGRAPFNAEPPLDRLRATFVTPPDLLYVRCHGDIPALDAGHRVSVGGLVAAPFAFDRAELQARFAPHRVLSVMQCAGNRRADLRAVRPVSGDPWGGGAIGHAAWTGARLADLLRAAGCRDGDGLHVAFESCDRAETGDGAARFGVSIPLAKAMHPDVLVAWAMDGQALTPEHGFPLRAVVPGYAGVRSPKWLSSITVQDRPSDAVQQSGDYKLFPPDMREETEDLSRGTTIDEMPVTSAICVPAPGARLAAGRVEVSGYAAASGRAIARVDLSGDGGRSWIQAAIEDHGGSPWSWTFWRAPLDLPPGEHELCVRAWDAAGQTQPALPDDVWNFKGYLSAAWHRVRVAVE